jgi:hypothetical protein
MAMLWASHRLRSGTTGSKMTAHRWIASHAPAGLQHAEMTMSTHHRVNYHQRVLQGCPPSPTWCCAAQETGVVVNRQVAPQSWQCSSTFLALDSDFFGEKPDSCGSLGSFLSWYDSLRLLVVPKTQETIERKAISDKRGHNSNDSRAKHHSERGFLGMSPTMAVPLGKVCEVPKRMFWGLLGFQRSKYVGFCFPSKGRILF